MKRRTKIIVTVGPATPDDSGIRSLLQAGADVVRVNFAHGTAEEHMERIRSVRRVAAELGRSVGVLADLPGPKMRTGHLVDDEEVQLRAGEMFTLSGDDVAGTREQVSTTVEGLASMTATGDEVYLADGAIVLKVVAVSGRDVITEIIRGGRLRSGKGMHLPRAEKHVQAFTEEDEVALERAVEMHVDLIGLSFVRDAEDVRRARAALPKRSRHIGIVGKIETGSAVDNLDEIIDAADAVMVARGDLGIQLPLAEVPALQKRIIRSCNLAGKPVITATQMLESMTRQPLPTRAEAADVANAVFDGTHALMLSEETAIGLYPWDAVREMASIASAAERSIEENAPSPLPHHMGQDRVSWAVAHAACQAAEDLGVAAILCPTRSGSTALRVAAFRPQMQIVALSERQEVLGGLNLVWGVTPLEMGPAPEPLTAEIDVDRAMKAAYSAGLLKQGDHVAVVAGTPGRRAGRTDYVRVVRVG